MATLLLPIIYLAFISLGLPDSLLGSAWPVLHHELNVPVSYAGIISMIIAFSTVISSLNSDRLTKKFGAGLVTAVSVAITCLSLFGFSVSHSFWLLCLIAIPYGLGGYFLFPKRYPNSKTVIEKPITVINSSVLIVNSPFVGFPEGFLYRTELELSGKN